MNERSIKDEVRRRYAPILAENEMLHAEVGRLRNDMRGSSVRGDRATHDTLDCYDRLPASVYPCGSLVRRRAGQDKPAIRPLRVRQCRDGRTYTMNTRIVGARARRAIASVCLWWLAATSAFTGLTAALAPHAFYDDVPLGRARVEMLPPYNEHLVSDVGGVYLAFTLLFAWAAVSLQRALVVPLCTAWIFAALLHFGYHVTHLDGWDLGDAVAQTVALALVLILPVAALAAVRRLPGHQPNVPSAEARQAS
jgi:hypothetical protein